MTFFSFSYNTRVRRTDGRADEQTDRQSDISALATPALA